MVYRETITRSWSQRVGSSFAGVVIGIILFLAGTALLIWNEHDFVKTRDALNEAWSLTLELADATHVDPSFNGQLVHASAFANTQDVIRDPFLGLGGVGIALERKVEFYQWHEREETETQRTTGGSEETVKTYSYMPDWVDHKVNARDFHSPEARVRYINFTLVDIDDQMQYAKNVSFGAYHLPNFFIEDLAEKGAEPYPVVLDQITQSKLSHNLTMRANQFGRRNPVNITVENNVVYLGSSPNVPEIGDVRLTYTITKPQNISLIAKVYGQTFEPYKASNGKEVRILALGQVSLEKMFADAQDSNVVMTWVLRLVGTILVIVGLWLILGPLATLASIVAILGSIVNLGIGLVSILVGLAWSLVVMAIAWLTARPLTGILMLAVAGGLLFLTYFKGQGQNPRRPRTTF